MWCSKDFPILSSETKMCKFGLMITQDFETAFAYFFSKVNVFRVTTLVRDVDVDKSEWKNN